MKAHATALVDPSAEIAADVEIGPYCIVGPGVQIGPGCVLLARVVVSGPAAIGCRNVLHPNVVIGGDRDGSKGRIEIGDDNVFREAVTVNGAVPSAGTTRIGSRNRFQACSRVGPGVTVGNDVFLGPLGAFSEGTVVQDRAWIEGLGGTAEPVTVGKGGWLPSHSVALEDVPPFMGIAGDAPEVVGVNPRFRSPALERAFETVWRSGLSRKEALARLERDATPEVAELVAFLRRPARETPDE